MARGFWASVGAVGALLGGAAALIVALRPAPVTAPAAESATARAPTYSEAMNCWGRSSRIYTRNAYFRQNGYGSETALQEAMVRLEAIKANAEAAAMRLGSENNRSALEVEQEHFTQYPVVVSMDYAASQRQRPNVAELISDAAEVTAMCEIFAAQR